MCNLNYAFIERNGMYTIFFITDSNYPTLRQEFSKNCGSFKTCSGRHEKSFLVSFMNVADLWAALVDQKEGVIGIRSLQLVFEERKSEDKEEGESCGHGDVTDIDNETEEKS